MGSKTNSQIISKDEKTRKQVIHTSYSRIFLDTTKSQFFFIQNETILSMQNSFDELQISENEARSSNIYTHNSWILIFLNLEVVDLNFCKDDLANKFWLLLNVHLASSCTFEKILTASGQSSTMGRQPRLLRQSCLNIFECWTRFRLESLQQKGFVQIWEILKEQ